MSTYLYLQCRNHDPPILSSGEVGQHLSDLEQIRADLTDREFTLRPWRAGWVPDEDPAQFRRHTMEFLEQHPHCHIAVRDEYGRPHSLIPDTEELEAEG